MLTKGSNRNKGSRATDPTTKPHLSLIAHEVTTPQSSGLARPSTSESPFCTFLSESTERALNSPPLPSHPLTSKTAHMPPFWSYPQNPTQGAKISQAYDMCILMKVRENKSFSLSPHARYEDGTKHPSQARASDPLPVCHLCHADRSSPRPRLSHLSDYQPPSSAITKSLYARAHRVLRVTPQATASSPLPVCYLHHPEGLPRAFIPFTLALDPSGQKCRDGPPLTPKRC